MFGFLTLSFVAYAFVSTITPGPNNLMLLASGANFGTRRTLSHMLGINFGVFILISLSGVGLVALFEAWPVVKLILAALCAAFLLYLAWRIAHADAPKAGGARGARPLTLLEGALFQWVNPKAWSMALTVVTLYLPFDVGLGETLLAAVVFALICMPSNLLWIISGERLRLFLGDVRRRRLFNRTMAALLIASLLPMLWPLLKEFAN